MKSDRITIRNGSTTATLTPSMAKRLAASVTEADVAAAALEARGLDTPGALTASGELASDWARRFAHRVGSFGGIALALEIAAAGTRSAMPARRRLTQSDRVRLRTLALRAERLERAAARLGRPTSGALVAAPPAAGRMRLLWL